MDFECKYPLTQNNKSHILAEWTKGYRSVELFYNGRSIKAFENGLQYLHKDLVVQDPELGEIKIRFSEKPIFMNLVVDGLHASINKTHPKQKIRMMAATYAFYVIIVIFMCLLLNTGGLVKRHQWQGLTGEQTITKISVFIFAISMGYFSNDLFEKGLNHITSP